MCIRLHFSGLHYGNNLLNSDVDANCHRMQYWPQSLQHTDELNEQSHDTDFNFGK